MRINSLKRKRGVGLVEIGLSLVIAGLIIFGVYSVFAGNSDDAKATNETTNYSALAKAVHDIYQSPNYTGLTIGNMITAGQVPKGMVDGNAAFNSDKGAVTLGPIQTTSGANRGYYIYTTNISKGVCTKLVSKAQRGFKLVAVLPVGSGAPANTSAISAASTIYSDGSVFTSKVFNPTDAQTLCGASDKVDVLLVDN